MCIAARYSCQIWIPEILWPAETAGGATSPTLRPASPVLKYRRRTKQPGSQPGILGSLPEVDMKEARSTLMTVAIAERTAIAKFIE